MPHIILSAIISIGVLGTSPHCNPMFCNCPLSETVSPNVVEISALLRYMRSNQGMPLSYLTPMSYWNTYNQIGGSPERRVQKAFGLDLKSSGALMLAYGLQRGWSSGQQIVDIVGMLKGNYTAIHGNGEQWLYGEVYQKYNDCGDKCGLYMQSISDRPAWPDPVRVGKKLCQFWSCPRFNFTSDPPQLRATVWAGMIGPLQLAWMQYVAAEGGTIPPGTPAIQMVMDLIDSIFGSTATIGGFYESPVLAYGEPLVINIASNLAFQSAITMARIISVQTANTGLTAKLDNTLLSCQRLFEGRDANNSFIAWDSTIGVFRESITILDPTNAPEEPTYASQWGLEAQLVGLNSYGIQLQRMFDRNEDAPLNLWAAVKSKFGHFNGDSVLIGFGEDPTGPVVTLTTMLGISAGAKLSRDYETVNPDASAMIAKDVYNMRNNILGLQAYGCKVRQNATIAENSTFATTGPAKFGYLATVKLTVGSDQELQTPLMADDKPPFVSLEEASWAMILNAVYDDNSQFNPFVLTNNLPGPISTPAPTGTSSENWFANNWGFIVGGISAFVAVVISVGKAVQLRRVRLKYRDLRAAQESHKGQNLGFF